jgi:hypothetical protein
MTSYDSPISILMVVSGIQTVFLNCIPCQLEKGFGTFVDFMPEGDAGTNPGKTATHDPQAPSVRVMPRRKKRSKTPPRNPRQKENSRIIALREQRRNHASAAPSGGPSGFPRN